MKKPNSQELLSRYMDGDKTISLRDIEKQEYLEMFLHRLDNWSFKKRFIKPIVFIPVFIFSLLFD